MIVPTFTLYGLGLGAMRRPFLVSQLCKAVPALVSERSEAGPIWAHGDLSLRPEWHDLNGHFEIRM
jgi:hypothetical protein